MKTAALMLALAAAVPACGGSDEPCDPDAPNTICTIAGSTKNEGYKGDDGPANEAVLYIPMDSAIAPNGEVWFIDFNNYVVRSIDSAGMIHTVFGTGLVGDSPADQMVASVPALDAGNNHTPNLAFGDGYLYLAAWHNSRIKRVKLDDMTVENYAGAGKRTFYDGDEGPALTAALDLPSSVAVSPTGEIVIMDQANQVVRSVDKNGVIHRIVGSCVVDINTQCAVGQQPTQCPGSDKTTCGDVATECANPCTPGYGGDNGPALEARISQPFGQWADPAGRITYDKTGDLILADTGNDRIRRIHDGIITTIAGTGVAGYSGDGGPATSAQINHPVDLAVADDNTVYFSDVMNNCIRKIDPSGVISTVAGQCNKDPKARAFGGDGGDPLKAKMDRPYGIDLVGKKLYVSDSYNNRLRVVNLP